MWAIFKTRIRNFLINIYREFHTRDALPLLVILLPVIFLMTIDSASFSLIWFWKGQVGRAGFTFLFFLVAWDWYDSEKRLSASRKRSRHVMGGIALAVVLIYYWQRVTNSEWTTYLRVYVTSQLGVSQKSPLSFLLAMDFVVYAVYCAIAVAVFYSPKAIPLVATPVTYSLGSGILNMMDAFFPEDSLAFLQIWVYVIWNVVVFLLSLMGFHTNHNVLEPVERPNIFLQGNNLYLWGTKGFIRLAIFWPSSGVVSMIVYSLVIAVIIVKLDAPRMNKLIYAMVEAAGTYFVNVIRIILIVVYVSFISLDVEAFHQSIGEILFITWIFVFLFILLQIENRRIRKYTTQNSSKANRTASTISNKVPLRR